MPAIFTKVNDTLSFVKPVLTVKMFRNVTSPRI